MVARKHNPCSTPCLLTAVLLLLGLLTLGGCGGDETVSSETGPLIDQAAVAQMDRNAFDEIMTEASDRLIERLLGDLPAFCALLLSLDRGYDAYQILDGALGDRLEADGRILAADGSVLAPVRPAEGFIDLGGNSAGGGAGAASSDLAAEPVLLACLSMPVLTADVDPASLPENAQIFSNLRTLAQLYGHFEEVKQAIRRQEAEEARKAQEALAEQERQNAQEEQRKREAAWNQQRTTSILNQLFASGYSAQQIVEAIILGECEPTRDTWGETVERMSGSMHWTLTHPSGGVLRPAHEPVTLSDGSYGPAKDQDAPTGYDPKDIEAALATPGAPDGQTPSSGEESGEAGASDGEPDGGETAASSPAEEGIPWVFEGTGLFRRSFTYYPEKINNVKATEVCEDPACPYVLTLFPDSRASLHVTRGFGFNADTGECLDADGNMYWGNWGTWEGDSFLNDGGFSILCKFSADGPIVDESFLVTGTFTADLATGEGGYGSEDDGSVYEFEDPGLVRKVD